MQPRYSINLRDSAKEGCPQEVSSLGMIKPHQQNKEHIRIMHTSLIKRYWPRPWPLWYGQPTYHAPDLDPINNDLAHVPKGLTLVFLAWVVEPATQDYAV